MKTLRDASIGSDVVVKKLHGEGAVKRRIMDMGITKGASVHIRKVAAGVAEGLQEDCSRIVLNSVLNFLQVSRIDEGSGDVVKRKRVLQKVVGSAVNGLLCHDVSAVGCKRLNCVRDCRCTGGHCQSGAASLERCHSLLENPLRRVRQTTVNVAGIRKTEAVCRMLCIVEYIRCCLINRYRSRIGCGIGLFLTYM